MAWEDNRSKSIREISKEERLKWLREQISQMEMANGKPAPSLLARVKPRIRRNGKWVE